MTLHFYSPLFITLPKVMLYVVILLLLTLFILLTYRFHKDIKRAKQKLLSYPLKVFNSSFGDISFIDEGQGEVVLISHGIFWRLRPRAGQSK